MAEQIHALIRELESVEEALTKARMERKKSTNNQQGMPAHLYSVSKMYSAIGKQLGLTGLEARFHALKDAVAALATEALDESKEWQAQLNGSSRSRSRSRRNRSRRSQSVS